MDSEFFLEHLEQFNITMNVPSCCVQLYQRINGKTLDKLILLYEMTRNNCVVSHVYLYHNIYQTLLVKSLTIPRKQTKYQLPKGNKRDP